MAQGTHRARSASRPQAVSRGTRPHGPALLAPIVEYVLEAERCCPNQQIAVLIPELVQRRWYHHLLHNKRASVLKALLL